MAAGGESTVCGACKKPVEDNQAGLQLRLFALSRRVGNIENWENRVKASVSDVIVSNGCSAGQRETAVVEAPEESLAESESNQSSTSSVETPSGDVGVNKTTPVTKTADENGGKSSCAICSENWADVVKGKRSNRRNKGSSEIKSSVTGTPTKLTRIKKSDVVLGTSTNHSAGLVSADKKAWLFVSRVGMSITHKEVKNHVLSFCAGDIHCEELRTKFPGYKSFKIAVPVDKREDLLKPEVWPAGVLVSNYVFPSRSKPRPTEKYSNADKGKNTFLGKRRSRSRRR
ncbi:hypothetical protein J6590_085132 [Homalodisca vitripennis]|nr:hypothetical protein J6590_085132 [Homalodisca vitripennis]